MRHRPYQDTQHAIPVHHSPHPAAAIPETTIKPWTLPPQKPYTFVDINIVDPVSGIIIPRRTVHIAHGKIISIRPVAEEGGLAPPRGPRGEGDSECEGPYGRVTKTCNEDIDMGGQRLLCTGKYLCPGLIDAHVHLTSVAGEPDLRSAMSVPLAVSLLRQPFQAKAMLERGFTTARDCGGASLALKEAIAEGLVPGPRLFIAGHALSQTGGHGDRRAALDVGGPACCGGGGPGGGGPTSDLSTVVDGVPAVLAAAREQFRQGADFLKLMVGGGVASPTDRLAGVQFTPEEIGAAAGVAAACGAFATAHAYTPGAIRRAVAAGVRGVEHGNFLDGDTARLLADKGCYLTPTLVAYQAMADPRYAAFLPAGSREKNEAVLEQGLRSLRVAHEAGVRMCFGSDLLSFLGVEQLGEFALRARVLPPGEVLKHATVNPAEMLGQEEVLGQVREGFVADLLVLNTNPLEDITSFERPEDHLLAVVKEGRVYSSRWSRLPVDVYRGTELIE